MYKKVTLLHCKKAHCMIFFSLTLFGWGRGRKIPASTQTFHNFLIRNDGNVNLGYFLQNFIRNYLIDFFD